MEISDQARRMIVGLLLIAIGILSFIMFFVEDSGPALVIVVGLMFLAAHFVIRRPSVLLVPGAIITGLGAGIYFTASGLSNQREWWPLALIGLAIGLGLIWFLERQQDWALLSSALLFVLGILLLLTTNEAGLTWNGWRRVGGPVAALVLAAMGVWVIVAFARGRGEEPPPPSTV